MTDVFYAIVAAVIALGLLIFVHELGHFLVAKRCGVGVITFSIGFGKKLLRWTYGETEYCISVFPLGGYVKMVGEDPDEEVVPQKLQQSFGQKSLGRRIAIVAAGPGFNLLLAGVMFFFVFLIAGVPYLTPEIGRVQPDSPAERAGVKAGDLVLSAGGADIETWQELSEAVRASRGAPVDLTLERAGKVVTVLVHPEEGERPNIFGETEKVWLVGIVSAGKIRTERSGPITAAQRAVYQTVEFSVVTLQALVKMLTLRLSPSNLGGPLMIAQTAGQQAQEGSTNFLFFMAILSVNLGVLNLLPIPVLDGGHLFFLLLELLRGRPVELRHRERAQQIGLFVLIFVMIYAFYNDLARFFNN